MALLVGKMDGITETLHFQDGDGTASLYREQDAEPILDANKRAQADGVGWSPSRELRHVARIPTLIYHEWCKVHGVDVLHPAHRDLLRRLLNDPDNRWLRVDGGRF
jgi:hypothetical protein